MEAPAAPIEGRLYDGRSSRPQTATLIAYADGTVGLRGAVEEGRWPAAALEVSARIGNTPRHLTLPDGRKFETVDNDGVDALLRGHGLGRAERLIHGLESRMAAVLVSLVVVVVAGWLLIDRGVPALARVVAFNLPTSITETLSRETFDLLDDKLFDPSELDEATRERLRDRFKALAAGYDASFDLRFRHGGETVGANAFALPSGTIVVTDELVALAENDEEVLAVMAHEVGHVVERHGLRQTLHHSMLTLLALYVTGDASSVVAVLPTVLVQLGYSRDFEREADRFALELMGRKGIEPQRFADILTRLDGEHRERQSRDRDTDILAYLSTHPPTEERVAAFH